MAPVKKTRKKEEKPDKRRVNNDVKKVGSKIKKKKRSHFNYSEEALALAIQDIRAKKKGIREACRDYGVPRSTVQDRLAGRVLEKPRKVGPEPILGFDGEQKVVDWIIDLAKCGIPVNKDALLDTVSNIIKDMGKSDKLPEGKRPGQTWYQGFLRRHPEISLREPEGINKARESVKESSIRKWFEVLKSFLDERGLLDMMEDPDRILNADETGIPLCPGTGKVLAPKGYKNVYIVKKGNEKESLTVLVTITASGKICPPLVIFPYVRPPKAVVDGMPEGWVLGKTESGWMRSDVFYEYIANDFNQWLIDNNVKRPVILFVDGHKSHMSMPLSQFCEDNDIILYALPPNTTHITQPADVSVFKPLKQEWKKTVSNWQTKPENHNQSVTKTNFCSVFKETLDKDMSESIKNGFRKCGLFPMNVEAVDFSKCVKDFQENRVKTYITETNKLMERDYISAEKVIIFIKETLQEKGIDTDTVINEINLAKRKMKDLRRSTSKTPRTSTEVPKNSSVTFEQPGDHNMTRVVNANDDGDNISLSLLDEPIIEIGSFVSLNDISIMNLSEFSLDQINVTPDLGEISIKQKKIVPELLSSSDSQLGCSSPSKITILADVHIDRLTKINIRREKDLSSPLNQKLENGNLNNNITDLSKNTKEHIIIDNKDKVNNDLGQEISIDPFQKHLKYIDNNTDKKTKKKEYYNLPSAISSNKWRDYFESKEKIKQNDEDSKKKRKAEREQKKNEVALKKKKTAEERKHKSKQNKNKEDTVKEIKNTDEDTENTDRYIRKINTKTNIKNTNINNIVKKKTDEDNTEADKDNRETDKDNTETDNTLRYKNDIPIQNDYILMDNNRLESIEEICRDYKIDTEIKKTSFKKSTGIDKDKTTRTKGRDTVTENIFAKFHGKLNENNENLTSDDEVYSIKKINFEENSGINKENTKCRETMKENIFSKTHDDEEVLSSDDDEYIFKIRKESKVKMNKQKITENEDNFST